MCIPIEERDDVRWLELLNQFNFEVRIKDDGPKGSVYMKREKWRYTNVHMTPSYDTGTWYEVHINYVSRSQGHRNFNIKEGEFRFLTIDRDYLGDPYTINLLCNLDEMEEYFHRIYPIESRKHKLKRIMKK